MRSWLTCCRYALPVVVAALLLSPARADDLADFNAAVERAAAHNRVALGYLRTQNVELATVELDRMRNAWGDLTGRFGMTPPAPLRDNRLYAETLIDVPMRLVSASLMLDMGRIDLAQNSLQAVRQKLGDMRRGSGVEVLADCVLAYNAAMAAFVAYDDAPPDWSRTNTVPEISARADAVAKAARHCDALAGDTVRDKPEFRRLIDGTLDSLAFMPKVIEAHDNDLLHRLIGELRAFDNLLVFRYG
jgi:hypothetical protein